MEDSAISAISHLIQLAVAPVFLLSGIGAMLAVMTSRLSRVVDRARNVEAKVAVTDEGARALAAELAILSRRARLISFSIGLCTVTALLVATVIAVMFLGAFFTFDASTFVALSFITAMAIFVAALLFFLREILLATAGLRFGHPL